MAFKIATNVSSINTQKWLGIAQSGMTKSLERLSSGYKINKAADDAAGTSIAAKLSVKSASLAKSIDNGNQAVAMLQAAEGGVEQITNILTRLKELATQSASSNTTTGDRAKLYQEQQDLHTEINRIAQSTKYGATSLLTGANTANLGANLTGANGITSVDVTDVVSTSGTFTLTSTTNGVGGVTLTLSNGSIAQTVNVANQTGSSTVIANFTGLGVKVTVNASATTISASNTFTITAGDSNFTYQVGDTNNASYDRVTAGLGNFVIGATGVLSALNGTDISSQANAQSYLTTLDTAMDSLNTERGKIGAAQNAIGYHVANLTTMNENTQSAISTVKDADFAKEMADFTKFQIISQSGVAMLAQANQLPQLVLSLLK